MLLTVPRSPGPTNQVFTCARSVAERQVRGGQEVLKRCDTARAGQQQALCNSYESWRVPCSCLAENICEACCCWRY